MVLSSDKFDALYAKDMVERVKYLNKAAVLAALAVLMFLLAAVNVQGQESEISLQRQALEIAQARILLACSDELATWDYWLETVTSDEEAEFNRLLDVRYEFLELCYSISEETTELWQWMDDSLFGALKTQWNDSFWGGESLHDLRSEDM